MVMAQGMVRGAQDLAQYADTLSQAQLRALRFRSDAQGHIRCPKKTTFTRFLHGVDDDALERTLLRWQDQVLGPIQDRIVKILYEQGGDDVVTVKANQETVQTTLQSLYSKQAFSPSPHSADPSDEAGAQPRAAGDSLAGLSGSDTPASVLPGGPPGGPLADTSST
jgi:hypothetical protein